MALTRFTLRQIEAFITVAEMLSFTAAGSRLGLTAQAVSRLIGELEELVGFRLFDRTTREVTLSVAGRHLLGSTETLMRQARAVDSAAADLRNGASGVVRVGAPLVMASMILPASVRDHHSVRPRVVIRIRDVAVEQLTDSVAAGDVDMAVGPDRACGNEVIAEPLFDSAWVLWCSREHPLARHERPIRWSDLRGAALVAAGRDHERSVAQMALSLPEGSRIIPVDVVDNISTALGIAAQGLAATLAPAYIGVLARTLNLEMRRVVDPETMRKVCLYRPTLRAATPAAEGFAEHLRGWLKNWHAQRVGNEK